jgi:hypothetical protein
MLGSEEQYVDEEYIPQGFTFKEPSKLSKVEAYDRIKFWYDRQENRSKKRVFQFRQIRGKDGEPEQLPGYKCRCKNSRRKKISPSPEPSDEEAQ